MEPPSFFGAAPNLPSDAIFALTAKFNSDDSPLKVNLGQGAYRDEKGSPWVLPSVVEARRRLARGRLEHEYLPILGLPEFRSAACKLAVGPQAFSTLQYRVGSV